MSGITVRYRASFRTARRGEREEPEEPVDAGPGWAARMLSLAHHLDRQIRSGALKNHADAARHLGITEGRISQLMNLLLLSPQIQEGLLLGRLHCGERRLREAASVAEWRQQEALLGDRVEPGT